MLFPEQPSDGWSGLEEMILREMILSVYSSLKPLDKFILMARHENEYNQAEIGKMIGTSQVAVHKRLKKIRRFLREAKDNGEL